jgi:hypothetical protein
MFSSVSGKIQALSMGQGGYGDEECRHGASLFSMHHNGATLEPPSRMDFCQHSLTKRCDEKLF